MYFISVSSFRSAFPRPQLLMLNVWSIGWGFLWAVSAGDLLKSKLLGFPLVKLLETRIKTMTMKLDFPNMVEVLSGPKKYVARPLRNESFCWVSPLDESSVSPGYLQAHCGWRITCSLLNKNKFLVAVYQNNDHNKRKFNKLWLFESVVDNWFNMI